MKTQLSKPARSKARYTDQYKQEALELWRASGRREGGSKSLREIGELFGGLDYAAVAQPIRRTNSTYNPIAARRLITTMLNV